MAPRRRGESQAGRGGVATLAGRWGSDETLPSRTRAAAVAVSVSETVSAAAATAAGQRLRRYGGPKARGSHRALLKRCSGAGRGRSEGGRLFRVSRSRGGVGPGTPIPWSIHSPAYAVWRGVVHRRRAEAGAQRHWESHGLAHLLSNRDFLRRGQISEIKGEDGLDPSTYPSPNPLLL